MARNLISASSFEPCGKLGSGLLYRIIYLHHCTQCVIIPCAGGVEEQQIKFEHHSGPGGLGGFPQAQPQRPRGEFPGTGGSCEPGRARGVLRPRQPEPSLLRPPHLSPAQPGRGGEHRLAAGPPGQPRHPLPPARLPPLLLPPPQGRGELWLPPGRRDRPGVSPEQVRGGGGTRGPLERPTLGAVRQREEQHGQQQGPPQHLPQPRHRVQLRRAGQGRPAEVRVALRHLQPGH